MDTKSIEKELFTLQDCPYRDFQSKLVPTIDSERIIGVRTPALKKFAKDLYQKGDFAEFLIDLPHHYFEENQLHAFLISQIKSFDECMEEVEKFLPYVDNWATCDQLLPKAFKKEPEKLLPYIQRWIRMAETYRVRFAIGMLMHYFLEEKFEQTFPEMVADVKSQEYYINMMIAWYFATALAKQYPAVLPFLEEHRLSPWVHNKTIQKAVESYRISPEQKAYLKTLKVSARKKE